MRQGMALVRYYLSADFNWELEGASFLLSIQPTHKAFIFTQARISAAFLDRFDHPHQYIPSDQLRIFYHYIPLERTTDLIRAMSHVITTVRDNH